jgi:hypothetical protein
MWRSPSSRTDLKEPAIPIQKSHLYRFKKATHSDAKEPPFSQILVA